MICLPYTLTNGFGVFSVIGRRQEPNPVAKDTDLITLHGFNASMPVDVIFPTTISPLTASSFTKRFTLPTDWLVASASPRCERLPFIE